MLGWENPVAIIVEAAQTAFGRVTAFFLACWLGCGIASLAAGSGWAIGGGALALPLMWVFGLVMGLAQGWGIIAYVVLFVLLMSLVHSEGRTVHLLLAALLVQAAESARLFATNGPMHWGELAMLLALVMAAYAAVLYADRHGRRLRAQRRYRRNMGRCVACGYDVRASIRAGSRDCPECGSEIPAYTISTIETWHEGTAA